MTPQPLRAVVVDNSSTVRAVLTAGLRERSIDVVGEGSDGHEAVELCARLRPDVLSLDLMMPGVDGRQAVEELRARRLPVPVVVVSSVASGTRAIELLEAGAVEVLAKPMPGEPVAGFLDRYAEQLRVASAAHVDNLWRDPHRHPAVNMSRRPVDERRLVVVAASTGGPRALHHVASLLPAELGCGLLVVQHMPPGFTRQLAARLDQGCALRVSEARTGDRIEAHRALIAPGGYHLRIERPGSVTVSDGDAVGALRPRADLTIVDAVEHYGNRVVLVVLTGMGSDGLQGARAVKANGGVVIVESEQTALIHGMPRAVASAGLADIALPLPDIADAICRSAG